MTRAAPGLRCSSRACSSTVDAALESGMLPVKLTSDTGDGQLEHYPVLTVGASVTVRGYTITVVADAGDTHTVTIAKVGEG